MVLAEARTLGIPILALSGGNVARLVDPAAGGELLSSHSELAATFRKLCREPSEIRRRRIAAQNHALVPRSWANVAREFAAIIELK
jgi:hypothetical protein